MASRIAGLALSALLMALVASAPARVSGASDARQALSLGAEDREHLLAGMRQYLESVQGIVDGLARRDMAAVAASAREAGAAMVAGVSLSAIVGLPPEFLVASLATHQSFDALADDVRAGATRQAVLDRLGGILAACNACHVSYSVPLQ